MNVKRFLGLALFTYMMCGAFVVVNQKDTPPQTYVETPVTITLGDLTPQQLKERAVELTTTTSTTTSTQPATTLAPFNAEAKCQEWFPLAVEVGWPNDPQVLQTLGRVMWKESRCQPDACSKSDSGRQCRDYGLTQGNWYAHHEWWTELGIEPQDMFDPATNLRWAYLLYSGREAKGQCGWQPWKMC